MLYFASNGLCAAGAGAFLEQQAGRLGISIVKRFSEVAFRGRHPCGLGTRGAVFLDAELVRAQERGAALEDLCAALAYSVARNYWKRSSQGTRSGGRFCFRAAPHRITPWWPLSDSGSAFR